MTSWKEFAMKAYRQIQIVEHESKDMELKEVCWDREVKEAVWKKGRINPDYSPHVLRWDKHGKIMMWSKYGKTDSIFGWSIEAHHPLEEGDLENLDNLYPVNNYSPQKK